jgi:type VI secretion system VasD/TssJ family lipoprotein
MKAMEMTVQGGSDMNNGGNAAVVRLYQLSGDSNFMRASLETFWRDDEETLGGELIAPKQEILLYPEQERAIDLNIGAETRYIGIAADLRAPDPVQWRKVFAAEELRGKQVTVTVGSDRLNVSY